MPTTIGVGYHNHVCIKLKTGQVHIRQFMHVGNSELRIAQLSNQAVHYAGFYMIAALRKKSHSTWLAAIILVEVIL